MNQHTHPENSPAPHSSAPHNSGTHNHETHNTTPTNENGICNADFHTSHNSPDQKIVLTVENVSFSYQNQTVLENINFTVNEGEYLGVIGPNGGGKSTLLKLMLGLIKPTSGKILVEGHNIDHFKKRFQLGYVPQRAAVTEIAYPVTVEEIVSTGRIAKTGPFKRLNKKDQEIIEKSMETTGVLDYRKRLIQNLSGGERQRVYIARALAGEPKILFLDEPTSGVDVSSQEKFYNFLGQLNHDLKLTIVFVSHDLDAVANQVSTVLCLNKRMVCHGHPRNYIKEDFIKKLYGPEMKIVSHDSAHHHHL